MRQYGFGYDELIFTADGNLPLDDDPKTAWALAHPERFPVEVSRAPYESLVRVPGIGPATARALVDGRRRSGDPVVGRSSSGRRGCREGGMVPHLARSPARELAGAATASALPARRAPDSGAVSNSRPALRLPLSHAAGGGDALERSRNVKSMICRALVWHRVCVCATGPPRERSIHAHRMD